MPFHEPTQTHARILSEPKNSTNHPNHLQVVEEEFEITDDDELADPAFLDPAGARDFDVALVSGADPSRRIDAERPLRLIRRNRTSGRRFFRTTAAGGGKSRVSRGERSRVNRGQVSWWVIKIQ